MYVAQILKRQDGNSLHLYVQNFSKARLIILYLYQNLVGVVDNKGIARWLPTSASDHHAPSRTHWDPVVGRNAEEITLVSCCKKQCERDCTVMLSPEEPLS